MSKKVDEPTTSSVTTPSRILPLPMQNPTPPKKSPSPTKPLTNRFSALVNFPPLPSTSPRSYAQALRIQPTRAPDFNIPWIMVWDYEFKRPSDEESLEIHRVFRVKWWERFQLGYNPTNPAAQASSSSNPIIQVSSSSNLIIQASSSSSPTPTANPKVLTLQQKNTALELELKSLRKKQASVFEDDQDPYENFFDDDDCDCVDLNYCDSLKD
ncbi:hypothetical protein Dimus_026672 [Dionaea muscipula]